MVLVWVWKGHVLWVWHVWLYIHLILGFHFICIKFLMSICSAWILNFSGLEIHLRPILKPWHGSAFLIAPFFWLEWLKHIIIVLGFSRMETRVLFMCIHIYSKWFSVAFDWRHVIMILIGYACIWPVISLFFSSLLKDTLSFWYSLLWACPFP